ncbi:MAG: hypothetical protein WDO15_15995 [Bacteroidota bacterium]
MMSLVAFMNIVYSFGMETTFFRYATKPGVDQKKIFNAGLTVVLAVGIFLSGSIIIFSAPIARSLGVGNHPDFIVWLGSDHVHRYTLRHFHLQGCVSSERQFDSRYTGLQTLRW